MRGSEGRDPPPVKLDPPRAPPEPPPPMQMRPLTAEDLPRAGALSARAGWNQNLADWRLFLDHGRAVAFDDGDTACLAATAAVLPFGADLAWISMVLVRPDRRRQGLATQLMRWAIAGLDGTGCIALDATPEGREVYWRLGFADAFGFTRWHLPRAPAAPSIATRPITEADWPALLATDATAFGAPRGTLLRAFAARLPAPCRIAADGRGFVLGRDGLRGPEIGPVVARDEATALALIAAAAHATGPASLDLRDAAAAIARALHEAGGEPRRPFTRMTRGAPLPGSPDQLFGMGGPEFG
jgi:GNAT superfamily N-acetyltransferase